MHNNSRHVYIEILYIVHLASFTNMATVDPEIVPETESPGSLTKVNIVPVGVRIGMALR